MKRSSGSANLSAAPEAMPRHIAVIMDGNGRWATARFLPRVAGHAKGVEAVRATVEGCARRGVEFLTLFAFSSENWRRPAEEVSLLMSLFISALEREVLQLDKNRIRLRVVGDLTPFEPKLRELIAKGEARTAKNTGMTLTIAANYGGRWDLLQAAQKAVAAARAIATPLTDSTIALSPGQMPLSPGQLPLPPALTDEALFSQHLALSYAPDPDLFIRTGGEQRISNFMLWQLAYTELYFTETYWPDFNDHELAKAIEAFRNRERRFGRTSAQLAEQ